jgi:hypothetical protein
MKGMKELKKYQISYYLAMLSILDLCENILYAENESWQCSFGHGEPVKLGIVLEAIDLGIDPKKGYSFVIDAHIIPQPNYLDEEIIDDAQSEGAGSKEELIRHVYESYGGVPVNIDAVQPAKASCGFSSFVAESHIDSMRDDYGDDIEVRHFQSLEDAMRFVRDFYTIYAALIFGFIDVILDSPLRAGGTGWDKIRQLTGR